MRYTKSYLLFEKGEEPLNMSTQLTISVEIMLMVQTKLPISKHLSKFGMLQHLYDEMWSLAE